ncbi:MAG: hypothetical protein MZV64_17170 [Ignavibacteriales bacterium]|nr:hypothetical protein [Ignavibacteriales bacterium]
MSRAAFVMDRFMRVVGLHGKVVHPDDPGSGCAVPAIYATRTIASRRDRVLTALLVPLMSCSARLPVYVVFGLAFFGARAGTVIWAMYALGIVVAMLAGMVFTRTILKPGCHVRVCAGTASLPSACVEERPDPHVGEHARIRPQGRDDDPLRVGGDVVPAQPSLGCDRINATHILENSAARSRPPLPRSGSATGKLAARS